MIPTRASAAIARARWPRVLVGATAAAVALWGTGCSDDAFDPITRIAAPRVLAVTSAPTVLAVDGEVRLEAITVDALGRRGRGERPVQAIRMRACSPWKLLADPARDCAGSDALPLTPDDDGRFAMATDALIDAFPPPTGAATVAALRAALAAGLELRVPVIAEVDVDGVTLTARREVWLAEAVGELRNPRFTEVRFDGVARTTLRAGQRYQLTVAFDRQSLDPARRDDAAPEALEQLNCNFYSPAGELAEREVDVERPDVDLPETEPNAYLAGAAGASWLYLVATDETGGMTFHEVALTIE